MLVVHRSQGPREFFRSGNVEALIAEIERDIEIGTEHTDGVWNSWGYAWLGTAEFVRGDWDRAGHWFRQASDTARIRSYCGWCWGSWFLYLAYSGRRAEALAFLEGKRSELPTPGQPNTTGAWGLLFALTEGLFVLDEREDPAAWYPLIVQAIRDTGTLIAPYAPGQVLERLAGIAATAAGNWHAAEEHFDLALQQADQLPHHVERLETRRFYAQMLLERGGDRHLAGRLLAEAIEGYRRLGMPHHETLARKMAREATP
jgi:tetratricopeptide (TPR) repeat protein